MEVLEKFPGETESYIIDFDDRLIPGSVLTGTAELTVSSDAPMGNDLMISDVNPTTAPTTFDDGRIVPAGRALKLTIGGGSARPSGRRDYVITATHGVGGEVVVARCVLRVLRATA